MVLMQTAELGAGQPAVGAPTTVERAPARLGLLRGRFYGFSAVALIWIVGAATTVALLK
jgi:hypothetical protein